MLLLIPYFKWFRKKAQSLSLGLAGLSASAMILGASTAEACGVCFTDPNSSLTKGALMGVVVLGAIIITGVVLIQGYRDTAAIHVKLDELIVSLNQAQ